MMSNMKQAIKFFTRIKELGCMIALDDFGSGLSSFGYLKKLPVDIVKIDGLFVRDIDVNEMDQVWWSVLSMTWPSKWVSTR